MLSHSRLFYFIFISLFFSKVTFAQKLEVDSLKIGIVLSGGGSKGFAHIGFLRALEEKNIKISYIAGTSMGALIGGLYAIGYSLDDIEAFISEVTFPNILTDQPDRPELNLYYKNESQENVLTIPTKNYLPTLPTSFSNGQNLIKFLSKVTIPVQGKKYFSQFKIPFLCISTDINNMKQYVLDHGVLAHALRATTSIPSVFKPWKENDLLYIDGGVLNNLPAYELKERGVNYIIAHSVEINKDSLKGENLGELLYKIGTIKMNENDKYQRQFIDKYIHTSIGALKGYSKNVVIENIQLGYENSKIKLENLPQKILSHKIDSVKYANKGISIPSSLYIKKILYSGNSIFKDTYFANKIRIALNEENSIANIESSIDQIYSTKNFDNISYNYIPKDSSLIFFIKEKESLKDYNIGLYHDNQISSALQIGLNFREWGIENSILDLKFNFGTFNKFNLSYFIDNGLNFGFGFDFVKQKFDVKSYLNSNIGIISSNTLEETPQNFKITYSNFNQNIKLYLAHQYINKFSLKYGLLYNFISLNLSDINITNLDASYLQSFTLGSFFTLKFDNLDNFYYPKKGFYLRAYIDNNYYLEEKEYSLSYYKEYFINNFAIEGKIKFPVPISEDFYLLYQFDAYSVFSPYFSRSRYRYLGGYEPSSYAETIFPFYGKNINNIENVHVGYLSGIQSLRYEVMKNNFVTLSAQIGAFNKLSTGANTVSQPFNLKEFQMGYDLSYGVSLWKVPISIHVSTDSEFEEYQMFYHFGYNF